MSSNLHRCAGGPLLEPQLSVVVPAFNEATNLPILTAELVRVLSSLGASWEIVFVDDGSTDGTWNVIAALHCRDRRIKGIQLSRNFGHQAAVLAGLSSARGRAVVCMDADLQHPPATIPRLVEEWKKGNKIVHTVRRDIDRLPMFKRLASRVYYKIFSFLSGVPLESGMADFRLFDRQVLDRILTFGEHDFFLRGISQWVGFPTAKVVFESPARFSGHSKYTLRKMLRFSLDGITAFSLVPLRLGIALGILTSVIAFWQLGYALYAKLILNATVPGWATTISVMSFMFGILFILLGLIGEYLGRVLAEVRGRPRYLINEQIGEAQSERTRESPERRIAHMPFIGPSKAEDTNKDVTPVG